MVVAKRQRKVKAWENGRKENRRTRVRTLGEANMPPSWLAHFAQGGLSREETKSMKRKLRQIEASPLRSAGPHASQLYYPRIWFLQWSCMDVRAGL